MRLPNPLTVSGGSFSSRLNDKGIERTIGSGIPFVPREMDLKCQSCGADNPDSETLCKTCGRELPQPPQVSKGVRALVYTISVLVPFAGFIVGAVLYWMPGREYRHVARYCIAFGIVLSVILLAVSLYVMTLGFGGCSCSTPGVNVLKKSNIAGGIKIELTAPTSEVQWDDVTIQLSNGTDVYSWTRITTSALTSTDPPAFWHDSKARPVGGTSFWLNVTDLAANGRISNGDFITLQIASPGVFPTGKVYQLNLLWEPSMGSMLNYDLAL